MIMIHNLIVSVIAIFSSIAHGWDYKEQEKWPETCQNAIAQSPIDLDEKDMVRIGMGPLVFKNWDMEHNVSMINNGHTVLLELSKKYPIGVTGGGLPGIYRLVQFHFHWGAEHTLNGKRKALESHFVTYNTHYKSIEEAMKYRNGIAVLTVLYSLSARPKDQFNPILEKVQSIRKTNQQTSIRFNPTKLLPRNLSKFWRYFGSLTTPDCNDVVVWTIFSKMPPISQEQVQEFMTIRQADGKLLSENYRSIQPLNGRTVYEICTDYNCCS